MKALFLFLAVLLASTCLYAKGVNNDFKVNTTNYADGILLEADNRDICLQLTIAGPGNSRHTQKYASAESVFIDINDANGQPLADGLYKYEAWPVPAVSYSREESSRMPDRNSLENTTGPDVSPVSGSFRIVNGVIDDPELIEYNDRDLEGAVQ